MGLSHLGHGVQVIARAPVDDPRPHVRIDDVDEWRFSVDRGNEMSLLLSSMHRAAEVFDRVSRQSDPDVVLIHQSIAGIGPILMRRHAARTWAHLCHTLAHAEYATRGTKAGSVLDQLRCSANMQGRYWTDHYVMTHCSRVIVLSEFMRDHVIRLHRIPNRRIRQIPGAADPERFQPASDRARGRRELGLPLDRTILFTVRTLVPAEGAGSAGGRHGPARGGCPGRHAWHRGEGPLQGALTEHVHRRGMADQVHLIGYVPEEQLAGYFRRRTSSSCRPCNSRVSVS